MPMSDYLEQRIMDLVLNSGDEFSFTSPTNVYIGLFEWAPSDSGGGTEISGGGYVRMDTGSFSTMTGVDDGLMTNLSEVLFPEATSDWGYIRSIGIFDAATGGNLLLYGDLTTNKVIDSGDNFKIRAGSLDITIDASGGEGPV